MHDMAHGTMSDKKSGRTGGHRGPEDGGDQELEDKYRRDERHERARQS